MSILTVIGIGLLELTLIMILSFKISDYLEDRFHYDGAMSFMASLFIQLSISLIITGLII